MALSVEDEDTLQELADLRKLLREVAERMTVLFIKEKVRINFNINQLDGGSEFRLLTYTAVKEIRIKD
jgi:hypothetical protein